MRYKTWERMLCDWERVLWYGITLMFVLWSRGREWDV